MGGGSISRGFRGEFRHWQIILGTCDTSIMANQFSVRDNPATLLALSWYWASGGVGSKDMVVLPYKDSLLLFSRCLQQLVMELLGKEFNLDGNRVNHRLTVYGNKGITDQHAYIQQLREGVHNFFVTFIEALCDRPPGHDWELEPGVTYGDYLFDLIVESTTAALKRSRTTCFVGSCRPTYMLDVWFGFIEINANLLSF